MAEIKLKRIFSTEKLEKLLLSDDIFNVSCEDNTILEYFKVPLSHLYRNYVLRVTFDGEVAGIVTFEPINRTVCVIHVSILEKFRKTDTTAVIMKAQLWMKKMTQNKQVIAYIPAYRKDLVRLCEKSKFKCRGIINNAFYKNNILHDLLLFQAEEQ